jgi:hypothetical protein
VREEQRLEALRLSREEHQHAEVTLPPPAAAPAPRIEEQPPVQEYRPEPEPRRVDPKELLESSGLVMIETDRAKAPAPAPQADEPQQLGRPRRERPKPAAPDDALEQIETSRK